MASKWINLTDAEQYAILEALPGTPVAKKILKAREKIKVSSAKGKGRNLQYWVCNQIAALLGISYNQSDDECLIHSREMGAHGLDVILRGEAKKRFPYSIECKNSESLDLVGTIRQAESNKLDGTDWLIVHKKKCLSHPIIIMEWDAFIRAVKK